MEMLESRENRKKYKSLSISSGGTMGLALCGAVEQLHIEGVLSSIVNFSGASVGSLVALCLACGASFNFLLKEVSNVKLDSLLDYRTRFHAIYNLYYYYGICNGSEMLKWIESILEKLTGDPDITFEQVHEKFGGHLIIVGTDLESHSPAYFDYINNPTMMVKIAVRISTSIPFVFQPVNYLGKTYTDGAMTTSLPNVFDPSETLYILLSQGKGVQIDTFQGMINALVNCYSGQIQQLINKQNVIEIPCDGSSADFYMSEESINELIEIGRNSVRKYFT